MQRKRGWKNETEREPLWVLMNVVTKQQQLVDDGAAAVKLTTCWTIEDVRDVVEGVLQD